MGKSYLLFFPSFIQQCDILKEFIQNSRVLPSAELKAFAESLVSNQLPLLTLPPLSFGHNTMVIEMAVHAAVVLFCGQNRILEPLRNLAFSPNTMLVRKFMLDFC